MSYCSLLLPCIVPTHAQAALAAIRIIRKVPELIEDFVPAAINLLNDKTHAVLLCAITLITEMIKIDPNTTSQFRKVRLPLIVRRCPLCVFRMLLPTAPDAPRRAFGVIMLLCDQLVPLVVGILKKMVLAGYVSEYDVCGITDPFLQCKIIQLLRLLGKGHPQTSQEMNDILAQVAINTEPTKNPGNAILYECVQVSLLLFSLFP